MRPTLFPKLLIALMVFAFLESLWRREWAKAGYWAGAAWINVAIEMM
jgi:hypothetical protein